ncbi:MAG: NAD(P)-dependent methylenetetrahydromethanopterin dehydrogenase [Gammaproteobacteria bacterium]|tara:strand:- start:340 stop:1242 length:903 start_codon:yes stop_codon:yes gene_type:complete
MSKPLIMHMITTAKNLSPFDVNMAYDAGWDKCVPYTEIEVDDVEGLVQDAIFSRPPGINKTGIFVGGRDPHKAIDMLKICKKSLVPPFTLSAFADPSGAFTTAAGMIAKVEDALKNKFNQDFLGQKIVVFGGTGPVGCIAGILAASAGAKVVIMGRKKEKCEELANFCKENYLDSSANISGASNDEFDSQIAEVDIVLASGAAGIQLVSEEQLNIATSLKVAADVNAVPPSGVTGLDAMQDCKELTASTSGALGIGALAIGQVKYQAQSKLLKKMANSEEPIFLDFHDALELAREYVSSK